MSDRKKLYDRLKDIQRIHTWQLVILLILSLFISATLLRMNNIGMVERRAAVISADEQGDKEVVIQRLYDLQTYVAAHMNTDLGKGVSLEKTYNKDLLDWKSKQYGDSNPNGNIFVKAQEVCAPQFSSWSLAYVTCVDNELSKYPAASEGGDEPGKPRAETYIYSFSSPIWTPDLAGWSVLISFAITLVIIGRLVTIGALHLMLRRRYKNI